MNSTELHKEIGTAKDNRKSPVHDWYRFTAGFSYKLVDKIIKDENLGKDDVIYESFAGCGTTLVSAQKRGIRAVGNEAQKLLFGVINAKLNWNINFTNIKNIINEIESSTSLNSNLIPIHELHKTLYSEGDLFQLYFIRDFIREKVKNVDEATFLELALTQTLHKVSIHPIAIPYISRSKTLSNSLSALETFKNTVIKMLLDLKSVKGLPKTTSIYLQDSREINSNIPDNSCSICITSPPYLNNLDYGEVSKVCSHFYGITDSWGDITEKVRKKLVTGATTHYKESEFKFEEWKLRDFYIENKKIMDSIMPDIFKIHEISKTRKGKKSFHILSLYYFEDMYKVLVEMKRVLRDGSKAYLVLGDSAPYGVFIDTTKMLGEIAKNVGFNDYKIIKIRERGTKWQSLRYRHSLKLSENILILE
ncbi:methyltransferase [Polaribacter sp. MSW13]|uniref:site-specific DNA-methyltransferase (cytosine-N(4)-specific) n=1 Tax=Polaribacter marinus TaxID=2916838 RepID=A0A9X1VPG2_9FLAO|nr:methyltransferase [Polaribacter marinus]MCI2229910.1 methyltransferase [Polaribacter marinus]